MKTVCNAIGRRAGVILLLAVGVVVILSAQSISRVEAQSTEALRVSNLGQAVGTAIPVREGRQWAQSFCTGSSASTLTRVRLYTAFMDWTSGPSPVIGASAVPVVTIRSDNAGEPGSVVHTLTNPTLDTDLDTAEDFTSGGYALLPSTRYWLTVGMPESSHRIRFFISGTPSTDEDPDTDPGWAIGDRALFNLNGTWREIWPINMRMAVFANGDATALESPVVPGRDCEGAASPFKLPVTENTAPGAVVGTVDAHGLDGDSLSRSAGGTGAELLNETFDLNASSDQTSISRGVPSMTNAL